MNAELTALFKAECSDRYDLSDGVDSSAGQDWYSLTLGWAIAKGLAPDEAHKFATHIRYGVDLG